MPDQHRLDVELRDDRCHVVGDVGDRRAVKRLGVGVGE
ncbi:Uncharacterised protein [Mycobacteroides abscessus subsp. abscessus]|nr:Uncharacterised protein [Mycobacteroides abscessus subsp. abscessus]